MKPPCSILEIPGTNDFRAGKGGVERHVRFLRVLSEPGHLERIADGSFVLIKNNHYRSEFETTLVLGLDVDALFVEAPQRLPYVRAAAKVRDKRFSTRPGCLHNMVCVFDECFAPSFHLHIFGRGMSRCPAHWDPLSPISS